MKLDLSFVRLLYGIVPIFYGLMSYIQVFTNKTFLIRRERTRRFVVSARRKRPILMGAAELLLATVWIGIGVFMLFYFEIN